MGRSKADVVVVLFCETKKAQNELIFIILFDDFIRSLFLFWRSVMFHCLMYISHWCMVVNLVREVP